MPIAMALILSLPLILHLRFKCGSIYSSKVPKYRVSACLREWVNPWYITPYIGVYIPPDLLVHVPKIHLPIVPNGWSRDHEQMISSTSVAPLKLEALFFFCVDSSVELATTSSDQCFHDSTPVCSCQVVLGSDCYNHCYLLITQTFGGLQVSWSGERRAVC